MLARHSSQNASTPYDSISFFDLRPWRFSTSSSTGRPWQSQPAIGVTIS